MSDFWEQAGSVVADVAPILGTALGGPLGGAAAGVITSVLGLGKSASAQQVIQAIQGATPEQILSLKAADQAFLTRSMELAAQVSQGQADTNKVEASATGWFVAGWRPFIGWVCGVALAWDQVIGPVLFSGIRAVPRLANAEMVHIDSGTLMPLLMGMLGIGAMRTIEKLNGVAGGEIIATPRQVSLGTTVRKTLEALPIPMPFPARASEPVEPITPPSPVVVQSNTGDIIITPPAVVLAPDPPPPVASVPVVPSPDRKGFFDAIRHTAFGGHMVQSQVEGCEKILDYWNTYAIGGDVRHLAYGLATVCWETGRTMQPIEEVGRGAGHAYGETGFYGRGLVQLTLEENYRRMSEIAECDLVAHPEKALEWPCALKVLFVGMSKGLFTGKRLSDFFNATVSDPTGARAIINGHDRAQEIADLYRAFLGALDAEQPIAPPAQL